MILGEHTVGGDPDCSEQGTCRPSNQTIDIEEIITHENFDERRLTSGHDIALLRLAKAARLHSVGTHFDNHWQK